MLIKVSLINLTLLDTSYILGIIFNSNLCLWDTLLPERSALVHKYTCLESGASAIAHSPALQLLVAGGKRGEISILVMTYHCPAHVDMFLSFNC